MPADSDYPPAVVNYFTGRRPRKSTDALDQLPRTKQAFKKLKDLNDIDSAIAALNTLGDAIEKDLLDGKHAGENADAAVTPDQKLQTYIYAIH
jgi:hypothetical protein